MQYDLTLNMPAFTLFVRLPYLCEWEDGRDDRAELAFVDQLTNLGQRLCIAYISADEIPPDVMGRGRLWGGELD